MVNPDVNSLIVPIIILGLIYEGLVIWTLINSIKRQNKLIYPILLTLSLVISPLGIVVMIVYWTTGKDSKRVDKELREAQLNALKKGNINVEIKGKMKKL